MVQIKKPTKRFTFIGIGVLILAAGAYFGIYHVTQSKADPTSDQPNFATLLPAHTTIDKYGGWQKLTPPEGGSSFYVYNDTISGVSLNVSQQVLPGRFKNNLTNEMNDLARAYNATTELETDDGTIVYVGTSAAGPQSAIFTKGGVLVLIKSWSTISDADWISYVNTLTLSK